MPASFFAPFCLRSLTVYWHKAIAQTVKVIEEGSDNGLVLARVWLGKENLCLLRRSYKKNWRVSNKGGRRMGGRSRQRHAKVICYLFMSLRKEASFTPGLLHAGWRPCKDGHWQWKGYTDMQPPFLKKRVSGRKMSWVFGLICFLEVKSWDRMKGSITFYFPKGSPSWFAWLSLACHGEERKA